MATVQIDWVETMAALTLHAVIDVTGERVLPW